MKLSLLVIIAILIPAVLSHAESDGEENNITNFVLKDSKGHEVHDLEVYLYADIGSYHCEADGRVTKYTIEPSLPNGLSFSYDGILTGTTYTPMNETVFTITANGYEYYYYEFTMRVVPCKYGPVTLIGMNGDANITLTLNSEVVFDRFVSIRTGMCIPMADFNYDITCTHLSRDHILNIGFTNELGHHIQKVSVELNERQTGILSLIETAPPKLAILPFQAVPHSLFQIHYECIGVQYETHIEPAIGNIQNAVVGIHNLQLVSTNSMGIGTVNFTLAVSVCPSGMTKLSFSRGRSDYNNERLEIYDPSNTIVYSTTLLDENVPEGFFCVEEGKPYHFHMYGLANSGWVERFPLKVFNSRGDVANFFMHGNLKEAWRHFYFATPIPWNSTYLYTKNTPSGNWISKKYKEKWNQARSESFGAFGSTNHVYVRNVFTVDNIDHYSQFFIDLQYRYQVTVYVNEVKVIEMEQPPEVYNHHFHLPLAYLQEGTNVLAIEIFNTNTSSIAAPIIFDASLTMATSQSFDLTYGGSISATQPFIDSKHPVDSAFDSDEKTFWNVTGYPSSVEYQFYYNEQRCVNSILFHQSLYDTPSLFRIEGVNPDKSTDLLYSLSSTIFMTENTYDLIQFDNTRLYPAYRIVFENSVHGIPAGFPIIKFLHTIPLSCKKRLGVSSTSLHTSLYKNCKFYQVGKKHVECLEEDNKAVWVDDSSACRSHIPSKPFAFIDSTVLIEGLNKENFETIRDKITEVITKHIIVLEEEISYVMLRDVSTDSAYITEVTMRFTVDYRVGDYVHFRLMESFIPSFPQYIKDIYPKYTASFVGEPKLYSPINWVMVIMITLLILAILIPVTIYYVVRRKPSKPTRKLRKEENNKLLENYV